MGKARAAALPLLTIALALHEPPVSALQPLDVTDGATVEAIVSIKDPTRIRVDGQPIVNVFGSVYSSNCAVGAAAPGAATGGPATLAPAVNPAGELAVECDGERGEVYVRPVGTSARPITLFVATRHATYTLLLRRSDTPADTVVLRDRTPMSAAPGADAPPARGSAPHVRAIKGLLLAMTTDRVPHDLQLEEVGQTVSLWREARLVLARLYRGRGLVGERYELTNVSSEDMVLAEQEFDRDGADVVAVGIAQHNLHPGDSTAVFVIRRAHER